MSSFSERMGFVKPPEFMQMDKISDSLDNLLYNFCGRLLKAFYIGGVVDLEDDINDLLKRKRRSFTLWNRNGSTRWFDEKLFLESYENLYFHQKYSVVEVVVVQAGTSSSTEELNKILEQENSGYRLNDEYQLVPISNQEELDEVSEAQHSKIDLVALHMNKAVACFSDREKPDYDNSIKESVSALEALAQKLSGEKGTLGALIKKLELHPSLKESVSKLYGYASDGGIRHAKKDGDPEVDFDTAKFVIVTSSALINFITAKCAND